MELSNSDPETQKQKELWQAVDLFYAAATNLFSVRRSLEKFDRSKEAVRYLPFDATARQIVTLSVLNERYSRQGLQIAKKIRELKLQNSQSKIWKRLIFRVNEASRKIDPHTCYYINEELLNDQRLLQDFFQQISLENEESVYALLKKLGVSGSVAEQLMCMFGGDLGNLSAFKREIITQDVDERAENVKNNLVFLGGMEDLEKHIIQVLGPQQNFADRFEYECFKYEAPIVANLTVLYRDWMERNSHIQKTIQIYREAFGRAAQPEPKPFQKNNAPKDENKILGLTETARRSRILELKQTRNSSIKVSQLQLKAVAEEIKQEARKSKQVSHKPITVIVQSDFRVEQLTDSSISSENAEDDNVSLDQKDIQAINPFLRQSIAKRINRISMKKKTRRLGLGCRLVDASEMMLSQQQNHAKGGINRPELMKSRTPRSKNSRAVYSTTGLGDTKSKSSIDYKIQERTSIPELSSASVSLSKNLSSRFGFGMLRTDAERHYVNGSRVNRIGKKDQNIFMKMKIHMNQKVGVRPKQSGRYNQKENGLLFLSVKNKTNLHLKIAELGNSVVDYDSFWSAKVRQDYGLLLNKYR